MSSSVTDRTAEDVEVAAQLDELVQRAEELRDELFEAGIAIDATGEDPTMAMEQCWKAGLYKLSIPRAYGGISPDGGWTFGLTALADVVTAISAIDGGLGQCFYTQHLVLRRIFDPMSELPEATLKDIASQLQDHDVRFVSSNAESGSPEPVTGRPTADGSLIVRGVKTFNTNSVIPGYGNVGVKVVAGEDGVGETMVGKQRHALIPLDHPNVTLHHDWDNMGQRGTQSQSITYDNVVVPAGWHYPRHPGTVGLRPLVAALNGFLMLGIGFGALEACLRYVRASNRPLMHQFGAATTDPLIQRYLGEFTVQLFAAQALMRQTMKEIEGLGEGVAETTDILARAMCSRHASLKAGLEVSAAIFDLMGGRSTASKYGLDRFWRNVRTFSVHDPQDEKLVGIGSWQLTGEMPDDVMKTLSRVVV